MNSRLALGTVQFGLPYGIANRAGQVTASEAQRILGHARGCGLDTLDTAISYGASEERLGEIGVGDWRIISKLPGLPTSCPDPHEWVRSMVSGSLERLRVSVLDGLLLHQPSDLAGPHATALHRALLAVRDRGLVRKIGVSVYDPSQLELLWPLYRFDLVQAPFNLLDRRLASSGWLARLHEAGTEVHVRSVFLQGLLLMSGAERPHQFARWQPLWSRLQAWLDEVSITPLEACLGFVLTRPEVHRVVIGVDNRQQLEQILDSLPGPQLTVPQDLCSDEPELINPARWASG